MMGGVSKGGVGVRDSINPITTNDAYRRHAREGPQ